MEKMKIIRTQFQQTPIRFSHRPLILEFKTDHNRFDTNISEYNVHYGANNLKIKQTIFANGTIGGECTDMVQGPWMQDTCLHVQRHLSIPF